MIINKEIDEDYKYANEKWVKGHSAIFVTGSNCPLRIDYIYKKNRLQIFFYNLILLYRFYRRKYVKNIR